MTKARTNAYGTTTLGSSTLTLGSATTSVTNLELVSPKELATISASAATGTINFDIVTQSVLYYTSNATANFTLNFRGSSSVTLNSFMNVGDTQTVVFLNTNGSTPYYPNSLTIDGTVVSPKWQGGTAPSGGNASSIDAWTYTILKTASATYTVLAAQTKFA